MTPSLPRVNTDGSDFVYSTYVGGNATDQGNRIAIDGEDNAYVAGWSDSSNFPTTAGSVQPGNAGGPDAFVLKLAPAGDQLVYSTYLGGSGVDAAYGIALDFANHAFVIGDTKSADFPVTANVVQPALAGDFDAFVAKLNGTGSAVVYATYLGGSKGEHGHAIAVDTATSAYVNGWTLSNDFPELSPLPSPKGAQDAFLAHLSHDGASLHFSTYYGGLAPDKAGPGGNTIAVDHQCQIYSTGQTLSPNLLTKDPFQAQPASLVDAFVLKMNPVVENDGPSITCRGAVLGTQTPVVRTISPNSIASVYGDEYTDGATVLSPETDAGGNVARILAGTCVEVNDQRTPIFAALATQVNFQVNRNLDQGWAKVRVVRDCGTANEVKSPPEYVRVAPTSPAFFNFVNNADGVNPIAAVHQDGVSLVAPPGLFGTAVTTTEAAPGEYVSLYFTGGGATDRSFVEGAIPGVAAGVTGTVELTIGGRLVAGADLFYVGVAPCCTGLYQAVGKIPPDAETGNHEVRLKIGDAISPPGPFIAVKRP